LKDERAPKKTDFGRIKIRLFGGSPRLWARSPRHGERRPAEAYLPRDSSTAKAGRRADEQPCSLYYELGLLRGRSPARGGAPGIRYTFIVILGIYFQGILKVRSNTVHEAEPIVRGAYFCDFVVEVSPSTCETSVFQNGN